MRFSQIATRLIEEPLVAVRTPMRGFRSMPLRLHAGVGTGREVATPVREAVRTDDVASWLRRLCLPALSTTTHASLSCTSG